LQISFIVHDVGPQKADLGVIGQGQWLKNGRERSTQGGWIVAEERKEEQLDIVEHIEE